MIINMILAGDDFVDPTGFFVGRADINGDGIVNILDIVGIINIILSQG